MTFLSRRFLGVTSTYSSSPTYSRDSSSENLMAGAMETWREKLEFLREQEAIASDAAQKFTLRKQIQAAEKMIRQLDS